MSVPWAKIGEQEGESGIQGVCVGGAVFQNVVGW